MRQGDMLDTRASWRAWGAILLFGGLFAAWLLVKPAPAVVVLGLDGVVQVLAPLCGLALCCWGRNRPGVIPILPRASSPPRQWVPLLVSAGLLAEALGQALGLFYALVLHQASTFPSWADAAFLGAFPFFLAAILLLPARSLSSALRARVVLDGLVVITALATCSWSVVLGPTLLQAHVATFAKVVSAAYPLGDLLLLACLLLLWTHATDRAMRPALLLFTLALSSLVLVDSIVEYQDLHGGFAPGGLTDVGAALSALLAGWGTAVLRRALAPSGERMRLTAAATRSNPTGVWRSLLPYSLLPLVGVLTVFDWRTNADARLTVGSLLGSGLLVAAVVARQIVALLDNSRLYRDLHESEGRLRTVISSTPVILFALDREGRITLAEGTGITDLGLTAEGVLGRSIFEVFPDMPQARASLQRALAGDTFTVQAKVSGLAFETRYTPLRDEAGATVGVLGVAMDITERRNAEETLRTSEERFRALTEHATDLITVLDAQGMVRYASPSYQRGLGYDPRDLCDTSAFDLVHPDDVASAREVVARLASAPNAVATLTLRVRRLDGSWRVLELVGKNRMHDPAVQGMIMTGRDITERVQMEDDLRHQALHDALTGLPNRALLHACLRQALAAARRDRTPLALLLLDLDRFKEVNDTFGHHYGDLLLQQVAGRLTGTLRSADLVARLGGDEFAVLLPDTDQGRAARVIEALCAALDAPFIIEGHVIHVGASTGLALYPEHGEDVDMLLRCADVAMYTAKRGRENHAVYTPAQDPYTPERLALVGDLREAIAGGMLLLHYQPKLELATGTVCGVEALVRWSHPRHGLVPPDRFILLAEQTGLIGPLTHRVLEAALRQGQDWQRRGVTVPIAVNLSMANLHDPRLVATVSELLQTYAVPASHLRIEITESTLMADVARTREVLAGLATLGVGISVDDFGAGHSSLAYLKRLPIDELKIDMSFIRHMTEDEADLAIVASTINLGHSLGLRVVAEGVEDEAAGDLLARLGCDIAQGYLIGRPLPAAEMERWLRERTHAAA